MKMTNLFALAIFTSGLFGGLFHENNRCLAQDDRIKIHTVPIDPDAQQQLQSAIVLAAPGDTIQLQEGVSK